MWILVALECPVHRFSAHCQVGCKHSHQVIMHRVHAKELGFVVVTCIPILVAFFLIEIKNSWQPLAWIMASGFLVEKTLYAPVTARYSSDIMSSTYFNSSSWRFFHEFFGGFSLSLADPSSVRTERSSGLSLILLCGVQNSHKKTKEFSSSSSDTVSPNLTGWNKPRTGVEV